MAKTKKIKSFTLDEEPYEALFGLFKGNYVDVSLSYCLNKYIKEFLRYLETIQDEMDRGEYTMPMSFVIETVARRPLFQVPDDRVSEGSEESSLIAEVKELQREYEAHTTKDTMDVQAKKEAAELDTLTAIVKLAKVVAKVAAREMTGQNLTDDQYVEIIRKEGGKALQRMVREKFAPAMGIENSGKRKPGAKKETEK